MRRQMIFVCLSLKYTTSLVGGQIFARLIHLNWINSTLADTDTRHWLWVYYIFEDKFSCKNGPTKNNTNMTWLWMYFVFFHSTQVKPKISGKKYKNNFFRDEALPSYTIHTRVVYICTKSFYAFLLKILLFFLPWFSLQFRSMNV